ncbi:hypothetical protein [Pseudoalteromonas rhizosphaerae]|uniref:hypothetical protein n=1 Tax=Pseudoalteromonas rhizosphaerae TaxID=2518973 RepID=UPI0021475154|nr:hypothetical protein [Pseudoalteromonas rhizosphaerae]
MLIKAYQSKLRSERYIQELRYACRTYLVQEGVNSRTQHALLTGDRNLDMEKYKEQVISRMVYRRAAMDKQTISEKLDNQASDSPKAEKLARSVFGLSTYRNL